MALLGFPVNTGMTQYPGLPNINLSGFEKLGAWHNRPQNWANTITIFQDNISYLMGKHTFRFGGEFAHIDVTNTVPDTGRGLIEFQGKKLPAAGFTALVPHAKSCSCPLEDFFAGIASAGQVLTGTPDRARDLEVVRSVLSG